MNPWVMDNTMVNSEEHWSETPCVKKKVQTQPPIGTLARVLHCWRVLDKAGTEMRKLRESQLSDSVFSMLDDVCSCQVCLISFGCFLRLATLLIMKRSNEVGHESFRFYRQYVRSSLEQTVSTFN